MEKNLLYKKIPTIKKHWMHDKNTIDIHSICHYSEKIIWCKCNKFPEHIWSCTAAAYTGGCPFCAGKRVCKENSLGFNYPELVSEWCYEKNNGKTPYDFVCKSNKKVWWKCNKGNDHEWETQISKRTEGKGCPCCSGHKCVKSTSLASTHPHLLEEWDYIKNTIKPDSITAASKYYAWWHCKKCGFQWSARAYHRKYGKGCPKCCESQGEKLISKLLEKTGCKYKSQVKFETCKNKKLLPFDFCVYKNDKIFLIEYQGEQHYKKFRFEKNDEKLKKRIINDNIKKQWCNKNNIPFLEIPYWQSSNECEHSLLNFLKS